ncbi:glypican-3-like [Arapaima gigas]
MCSSPPLAAEICRGDLQYPPDSNQESDPLCPLAPTRTPSELQNGRGRRRGRSLILLRVVTTPERRWRARSGRGQQAHGGEEGSESGDCDDEDECGGASGLGPPPRHRRLRIFADLADNLAMDDFSFPGHTLNPSDTEGGASATGAARDPFRAGALSPGAVVLLTVTVFLLGPR